MAEFRSNVGLEQVATEGALAQRALVEAVGTQVEMATPGSPRRLLFDRLMSGASLREAVEIPGLDLGAYPERSAALIKAYVDDRRIFEGRASSIGISSQEVAAARYVAVRPVTTADIRAAMQSVGGRRAQNALYSLPQIEAIRREKARVNAGLPKAAAQLAELERAGMRGTPAHRLALQDYSDLMAAVVTTGAENISAEKGDAASKAIETLSRGREEGGYDLDALKGVSAIIDQDRGVVGAVRTGEGNPDHGYRFAGWEHAEDVVLTPQHEAQLALEADSSFNAEFLERRASREDTRDYYDYIRATHQAALDQSISGAPKYNPQQASIWLTPTETTQVPASGPNDSLGHEIFEGGQDAGLEHEPFDGDGVGPDDGYEPEPFDGDKTVGPDRSSEPFVAPKGNPLVVTADHADLSIHVEESLRQHKAMQARVLVSLGFTALQGGVSFMESSSRWAANPDGGATAYAFGNVMLGLNGVNTSMQTYFQSKDAKDKVFGQLIQEQKEAQGAVGKAYQAKALGVISQLEAIQPDVKMLHAAEVEVLTENRPLLDQAWESYQRGESTAIYREILSQASQSGNAALADAAKQELKVLEKKVAAGQAYTQADFHKTIGLDGKVGGIKADLTSAGGALDRLHLAEGAAAGKTDAHLASIERNYLDARRLTFEQEWLSSDGRQALLAKFSEVAKQNGWTPDEAGVLKLTSKEGAEQSLTPNEILHGYSDKWVLERGLIEDNVRLIDKRPDLAASIRRHGMDATSLLESLYTHQSSASSNNVRVADALRKTLATPEGAALLPEGWDKDGQRHIGVADLGNGQYAAYLVGHDQSGQAVEGRLVLLNQAVDATGQPSIRLAGSVPISKGEMWSFFGAGDPDKLRTRIREGLLQGLSNRTLQDRARALGTTVGGLSGVEVDEAEAEARRQVESFTALNDRVTMNSLARAISQSSSEEGHQKLAMGPAHASILEFPKPSNAVRLRPAERLQSMDVAVNDANHLMHRGIRQMQDLHGFTPLAVLKRLDSDRKDGEARREFDATRGAFDAPHVRERAKSDLFTGRMGRNSRPNDQGLVKIDLADIA